MIPGFGVEVAAKHGVSDAALKYHLYKTLPAKPVKSSSPGLRPVRLSGSVAKQIEFEFGGGLRLRFEEGCDSNARQRPKLAALPTDR